MNGKPTRPTHGESEASWCAWCRARFPPGVEMEMVEIPRYIIALPVSWLAHIGVAHGWDKDMIEAAHATWPRPSAEALRVWAETRTRSDKT